MIPSRIDHIEQGISRLPEQFKEKLNVEGLLKGWLSAVQTTEDRLFDLLNFRSLDTAQGVQLDQLGKIVGSFRSGSSDSEYRDRIKLQILINTSEGTPDDLLEILSLTTNASIVKYYRHGTMEGTFYSNGDNFPSNLARTLTQCMPLCHGNTQVYQDTNNDCFIPVELVGSSGLLIDANGNLIVDANGNNILVGSLGGQISQDVWRGIPSEIGQSSNVSPLCEISDR